MTATREAITARVRRVRQGVVVTALAAAVAASAAIGLNTSSSSATAAPATKQPSVKNTAPTSPAAPRNHHQRAQQRAVGKTAVQKPQPPVGVTPPVHHQSHATTSGS